MFKYIKQVLINGPRVIFAYFSWMIKFSKHPNKYPKDIRFNKTKKIINKVIKDFKSDIHIIGKENIVNGTAFYVSNHLSMLDPLYYFLANDNVCSIVAKIETKKLPFVARCIKSIDGLFIDRKDLKQSLKVMMKVEEDLKNNNHSWLIFPEGTRGKDYKKNLINFHYGTFRPAVKAQVPIVPCAIYGSFRVAKSSVYYKKYPIYIEYGKPIMPNEYKNMSTEELALLVQQKVQSMITFNARNYDHNEMSKLKSKHYHFNEIKDFK